MSENTLTDHVRNEYSSPQWVTAAEEAALYARFDTMLKQEKADAWDEGYQDCHSFNQGHIFEPHNPYRKQEEA